MALRRIVLGVSGALLRLAERRSSTRERPARPRVLLIRPDHLGDLLMASPAVEAVRKALPEAHLTMMVGPWSAEVARRDPLPDEVLICQFPGFTRAVRASALEPYRLLWCTAREIRRGRYDAALVLRFDHWWGAWLAALAGIPIRVGHRVPECAPFLTHSIDPPGRIHWVEQGLRPAARLLEAWGIPSGQVLPSPALRFGTREADEREADRLWLTLGFEPGTPVVAFHPGAGATVKLWPEERWVELGRALSDRGSRIIVTGTPAESDGACRIAAAVAGARSLAGRTELGTLAALFRKSGLVVGVDSGALHLAVAIGVRTIHLFGPSDPAIFGPWGDRSRHKVVSAMAPCSPCDRLDLRASAGEYSPCMRAISAERVVAVCLEVLSAEC